MFNTILIQKTEDKGFVVVVDGKIADCLCIDEALGTVAATMYTGEAPYLCSPDQWELRGTARISGAIDALRQWQTAEKLQDRKELNNAKQSRDGALRTYDFMAKDSKDVDK